MARWVFLAAMAALGILVVSRSWSVANVSGVVWDSAGRAVPNAVIRVKGRAAETVTDADGRFSISGFTPAFRIRLTAWRKDFYIDGADVWPWNSRVEVRLARLPARDHADYSWQPPSIDDRSATLDHVVRTSLDLAGRLFPERGVRAVATVFTTGCRDCHNTIFEQWAGSAHALGAANPRFLTLYNGTNVDGAASPRTRYVGDRDYGSVPLAPDPAADDYGPGFKLDFPESAGNCATCHLPSAALDHPSDADPNRVVGTMARGTHCDFCHKTADVVLDPRTALPADNMTGALSMRLVRPGPGAQVFFGPLDDVDGGRDSRAAVMKQSEVCAPCHQGAFWGVPMYESFAEWKASSFPGQGKTCQSCHMAPDGRMDNMAPRRGGISRAPATLATHGFPGASSQALLQSAAHLAVLPSRTRDRLRVDVTVTNSGTGHRLPTDSPLREVLLVVRAVDSRGAPVTLTDGPTLPAWAGDLAGAPGIYFAKLLEQRWTNVLPSAAFWTQTRIAEDTRLAPGAAITRVFEFNVPEGGAAVVDARLVLRRAPYALMQQKGWRAPDMEMNHEVVRIGPYVGRGTPSS